MIINLIIILFRVYETIILVRVILSWVQTDRNNPLIEFLDRLTEPVLAPVRNILHTERMGFDISPIVVLFLLEFLKKMILSFL